MTAVPAAGRPSGSRLGSEPAEQSVEQPVEQSVEQPVEQSVEQPLAALSALAATTRRLDLLHGLALLEHPDVYQRIHTELQSVLADIDDA